MSWLFFFSYRELPRGLEKLVSEATIWMYSAVQALSCAGRSMLA
jgi:hypothetical protein